MSDDATVGNRDQVVAAMVSALEEAFGARACAVAEAQVEAADGESRGAWAIILARLQADRGHPARP